MRIHNVRENNNCTSNPDPVEPQKQPIVCSHSECGKSFTKPIELNIRIENERARYYACPYCFWPVASETVMLEKTNLERTENLSHIDAIKPEGCKHSIGYLTTIPQNSSLPYECLTCVSILKCMVLKKKRKIKRDKPLFRM
jgi:DNA-directed RNA polymerase subunit RPC12/RpoP